MFSARSVYVDRRQAVDDWGERTWTGSEFDAPYLPGRILADDPSTFRATLRWLRLDRVQVNMFTAGAHRYEAGTVPAGRSEPFPLLQPETIMVFAISDGDVRVERPAGLITIHRGDVVLCGPSMPESYHAPGRMRIVWSVVGREHVPPHLLPAPPLPAVLPRTPLVNGYAGFLSALLTSRMGEFRTGLTDPYLSQTVIDLQLGALAERRRSVNPESTKTALRRRIEEHVRAHLDDPALDPAGIAGALGISIRYAHQIFNRDGLTLAAFVRDCRLEAVADALRAPERFDLLGDLAERHGFHSRDQLTRAFRRRYGVTMGDFREQQHRAAARRAS